MKKSWETAEGFEKIKRRDLPHQKTKGRFNDRKHQRREKQHAQEQVLKNGFSFS